MKDIVIYPNRHYLMALAAACLLLVGACVYPLIYGYDISGRDELGQFLKAVTPGIFYIGAPLFGLFLIYVCHQLLRPKPSVIINQEGIFDNASLLGAGMIRWDEIKSVFIYKVMNNSLLGIIPVDIESVLARQSIIKRFLFRMNKGMSQAPFAIPDNSLPMSAEELLAKIQLYREGLS